jgi:hypothetical protein
MKKLFGNTFILAIIIGGLCTGCNQTPTAKECDSVCQYLKQNNLSEKQAIEILSRQSTQSDSTESVTCFENCCDSIQFCGITKKELMQNMALYRNDIWAQTSTINSGVCTTYTSADALDARFMEIDIDELENYICNVKKMAIADGSSIASIRFYYIKYPGSISPGTSGTSATSNPWAGCHTLALVPTLTSTGADYIFDTLNIYVPNICIKNSAANHTNICPPMTGCNLTNTLIPQNDLNY